MTIFPPMALRPCTGQVLIIEISRSQDPSGRVISSSRRPLPNNTLHSKQKKVHTPSGIRTHNLSRRAAADLCLRPRSHCDRHHHHHHMSVMELGHLLTRSGLAYLEVSSEVCHDSFCQLGNSVSLSWVVCHEAFCFHVVCSSSCIPVVYLEPVLFLTLLQFVHLFCNLPKCILLIFSYISSLLLLFFWHPLL